jgi:hypothetical protein
LSENHPEVSKQEILDRIKLMNFLCFYCHSEKHISPAVLDYQSHGSGPHATGVYICPDCKSKFTVKIEDVGRVR